MPKGTYSNSKIAKKNAKLIILNTKCDAVKLKAITKTSLSSKN